MLAMEFHEPSRRRAMGFHFFGRVWGERVFGPGPPVSRRAGVLETI